MTQHTITPEVTRKAVSLLAACVNNSETWALRFVLERTFPTSRVVPLPDLQPATIRQALADGRLTISEAASLSDVMSKLANVEAVQTLEARLEELEMLLLGTPQTIVSGQ